MPDVVLLGLALLAGCHFQACRTQGLFGQTEDWYIISTVRIEADSNKIDWSLLTVNMTEIEPESSMQYYYDGYDYEVPTGNYGDHIMFIGAECVQYSLATEAGGPAVPGAILVQADVWAGANALERLPDYVNFSNAPGALPASQCPGQCTDMNVATSPAVPYLMLLMTDGMPGGEYDSYTINLTTYGPSAPECANAINTSVAPLTAGMQFPMGTPDVLTAIYYQNLQEVVQPSPTSPNFTAHPQFLVQNASCIHYALWLPGVPVADREKYSLTLYDTVQLAEAIFARDNTPQYQLSSCTGATCNVTASQWVKKYGLDPTANYWLVSSYQWFTTTQVAKFWSFTRAFLPEECQAQLDGQVANTSVSSAAQGTGSPVGTANVAAAANSAGKKGPIAGGVVGGAAALALVGIAIFLLIRRKQRTHATSKDSEAPTSKASDGTSMGGWASSKNAGQISGAGTSSGGSHGTSSTATTAGQSRGTSASEESWIIDARSIKFRLGSDGTPLKLGQGGFGSVYLGVQDDVREVACKVLRSDGTNLREEKAFRDEIYRLAECRDRNVVQFYGCVLGADTMLITEYCERGDLFDALADGSDTCSWYQRGQAIALDIAKGLHALHSRHLVHFDIKSPNILLTKNYEAKIADVGLSYQLRHTHASNVSNRGTWAWQSPEILLGHGAGTAADVWSYGVVLYEILSGEKPMRGRLRQISVPEEGPLQAEQLMDACLLDNPADRPTMKEVIERLLLFVRT